MIEIDGVIQGSYRVFAENGMDLNRRWHSPRRSRHPVIFKIRELIENIMDSQGIALYVDFHGHSRSPGTFAFASPDKAGSSEKFFPRTLSLLNEDFSWEGCVFSSPKRREEAARMVMRQDFGLIQSFTIETSFAGMITGRHAGLLYDELLWKRLGSSCGLAIAHFMLGERSPVLSFAIKEVRFIYCNPSAQKSVRTKKRKTSTQDSVGRDLQRLSQGQKCVTQQPKYTFITRMSDITTEKPECTVVKWNPMLYVEKM